MKLEFTGQTLILQRSYSYCRILLVSVLLRNLRADVRDGPLRAFLTDLFLLCFDFFSQRVRVGAVPITGLF